MSYPFDINLEGGQETVHEFRVCCNILPTRHLIKLLLMSEG